MKKLFLMLAAATFAANVSAQGTATTGNKFGDNWYIGINAGVATDMTKSGWYDGIAYDAKGAGFMKGFAPNVGIRLGKNLTTVFGLVADANLYFESSKKSSLYSNTFIDALTLNLLGSFNLSNLFAGYKGEPRAFEIIALGGFGWAHGFTSPSSRLNALDSKLALDLALNLGSSKAIQLYLEPAFVYNLHTWNNGRAGKTDMKFDSQNGYFQLNVGLNYKFGTSNGTHNFAKSQLRDQNEIDGLNAKINELRADNNAKDGKIATDARTIADLQAQLAACKNQKPTETVVVKKENTQLQPIVIFRQGKSTIDAAQYASIEMVAKYLRNHKDAKVNVKGYASPEGKPELNKKLSEARANAVKNALVKRYKIAADRITTEGMGATSEISEENDFNRVAMFFDVTK